MNILLVGNVLKDVYLNLDSRTEAFETDKTGTKWLDLSFNASEHRFFSRTTNFGGAAVSLEVLQKLGLEAKINNSNLNFADEDTSNDTPETVAAHRYILSSDEKVTYFVPSEFTPTSFTPPDTPIDYLYIDRSASLTHKTAHQIAHFIKKTPSTRLIIYARNFLDHALNSLIPSADLIFVENPAISDALPSPSTPVNDTPLSATDTYIAQICQTLNISPLDPHKLIFISENSFSYLGISEPISPTRIDMMTHLSLYSIASATILGCFILGLSVEESLRLARTNVENSKLNTSLSLEQLRELARVRTATNSDLELIAASLLLPGKGILAADESGGSIHKKFAKLNIPDTYDNRRDYRNLFFTTDGLENSISGIILFDETARQLADTGQTFVDFLTARRIIPGIKVDQGLAKFPDSEETYTQGLDDLDARLAEYYQMGLRFAKWRAAFEITKNPDGQILTPTAHAIDRNCQILAEYASKCQAAGLVPIVEPEVVHDGNYSIDDCEAVTSQILDALFSALQAKNINLRACILKVNMVLAGKQFEAASSPTAVGLRTAETLKHHVPDELAGVVFLSGGQTPEQATANLAAIIKNGPFPWPVTFSFARALQDPALYAWAGDNSNADAARQAFARRLAKNIKAIKI